MTDEKVTPATAQIIKKAPPAKPQRYRKAMAVGAPAAWAKALREWNKR